MEFEPDTQTVNFTPRDLVRVMEKRNDPYLQLVRNTRTYQTPKGYMRWELLSGLVAAALASLYEPNPLLVPDTPSVMHNHRTALWFVQNAPLYCISKELLRAFQLTDVLVPDFLRDLEPPLPTIMLLFPENAVLTAEGNPVDWAMIHFSDLQYPERSTAEGYGFKVPHLRHKLVRHLQWSTADSVGTVWMSGMGVDQNGEILIEENEIISDPTTAADHEFLRQMRSLTVQCLLALRYRSDLISETEAPARKKSPHRAGTASPIMHPRWLGKDYVRPNYRGRGTHASPDSHWRRGHLRLQPVGPGRTGRRPIWIEPTYVGAKQS